MYSRVQYISQGRTPEEQLRNIQAVLDAGYNWIQLRFKHQEEHALLPVAAQVKRLCESYQATFIMNDHVQIAKAVDAHGVHLGLTDTSVSEARRMLGNEKIIGGTANTLAHVVQRMDEGCNYIGLGPFRFTTTKEKLSPILGPEGYQNIMEALSEQERTTPVYAIGGIEHADFEGLRDIGIFGIAVSSLLTNVTPIPQGLFQQPSTIPS